MASAVLGLAVMAGCAQLIGAEFDGARLGGDAGAQATDGGEGSDAATSPGLDAALDGASTGSEFDAQVGDLVFWVAADRGVIDGGPPEGGAPDGGGVLAPTWQDQSGRAHHLTQTFIAKQPLVVGAARNGLPAIRFERARGTCYMSSWLGPPGVSGTTVFIVARGAPTSLVRFQGPSPGYLVFPWNSRYYDTDAAPDYFFLVSSGGDTNKIRAPFDERAWTLAVARLEVGKIGGMQVFENGVLLESSSIFADAAPAPDAFQVGCAPGQLSEFANADVAEIMIYASALPDAARVGVETYLKEKWSLPF